MKILKKILEAKEDLSKLPDEAMSAVQKNIREGAKDLEIEWANALALVHKAYEVASVTRPSPDMRSAWEQYEENITYAVKHLAKQRGLDDKDWRMSSAKFRESDEGSMFKVEFGDKTFKIKLPNMLALSIALSQTGASVATMPSEDSSRILVSLDNLSGEVKISKCGQMLSSISKP